MKKAITQVPDVIRAYSYLRFSALVQVRGDSRRRQEDFAARLCEQNSWVLDDSLTLHDLGVSAYRGKNAREGALAQFLDAVKSGRVRKGSVLVVENIDRLSRSKVGEALQLFIQLLNHGITIVTADPERTYTQGSINDIAALLEPIIYMSRAHEESRMKSMRVGKAWGERKRKAAEDGTPHTAMTPYWVEVHEGQYRLIPDRARAVQAIFRLATDGLGSGRIVRSLKADPDRFPPFGKSQKWNRGYVEMILRNPAVYGQHQQYAVDPESGEKRPQGQPLQAYFPAAVSEEQFYAARASIEGRCRKSGRPSKGELNLFTGMVFEAVEKLPMHLRSVQPAKAKGKLKTPRRYSYLTSKAFHLGESLGGSDRFSRCLEYKAFESAVLTMMTELSAADVTTPTGQADEYGEVIRRLTEELTAHDQKLRVYQAKAADPKTPKASLPAYLELMEGAAQEKERVGKALEYLKAEAMSGRPETLGEVQSFVRMLDGLDGEEAESVRVRLRARLRTLVGEIWVAVEKVGYNRRAAHIRVYLRGGLSRYLLVFSPALADNEAPCPGLLDLADVDLRKLAV